MHRLILQLHTTDYYYRFILFMKLAVLDKTSHLFDVAAGTCGVRASLRFTAV